MVRTESNVNARLKRTAIIRGVCNVVASLMLIFAYAGFSWGEYLSPVQRSGVAVSFVFDISNSMTVCDGPERTSRLEAASVYARKLLDKMNGISVSVVLAKGEGVVAIPLTEDYSIVESLLSVLSPRLMTVPGTSLGKGILTAKGTFPQSFSRAGRIFVFTDGEETDGELKNALEECTKSGIPVSIIGFGSETETEFMLADGKTSVMSALRSENVKNIIKAVEGKLKHTRNIGNLAYINSNERGSAAVLLKQLSTTDGNTDKILSYETKVVPRYKLFLFLGLLFFVAGFVVTEFDFSKMFKKLRKISGVLACFIFLGCSSNTAAILDGTMKWHKKEYEKAVAAFKNVSQSSAAQENDALKAYAQYNLGTAYFTMEENDSAFNQYVKIPQNAPGRVRYAAYYNTGIIFYKNGDFEQAKEYFRKAIEADSSRIDAKINMELSMKMIEVKGQQSQSQAIPAAEDNSKQPDVEDALFEHIKENDQKQWKNSETVQTSDFSNDY